MKILFKTAPAAVLSLMLIGGAAYSDAGFAYGANNSEALTTETIHVDANVLAADTAVRDATSIEPVSASLPKNSEIIFTPGTGVPSVHAEAEAPAEEGEKILTADSLADLVEAHGAAEDLGSEEQCLASAVYFESKGESLEGQLAVARVVIARTQSGRFPSTICGVVYQPSQFSFVRGGRMPSINMGSRHWRNAVAISKIARDASWKSPVEGALFFHARHVSPGWRLKRMGAVDNHVFYR
ncbi:MAG: hypothetical protein RIQ28_788 [Pseudomonadota bacterium]|jgi:hypothetical protein